jgi:predicted AAA+ superfamily ATPase
MPYVRRVLDDTLDEVLPVLQAVALQGPKGVGKTATALQRASTVLRLDDARQRDVYAADPDRLGSLRPPVLIDEWQRLPAVWDDVRRAVDNGAAAGQFLLTGSAAPAGATIHSGAARIVDFRLRPLSLAERELVLPTVSLAELLSGAKPPVAGVSPVGLDEYVDELLRSGFPGIRGLPDRARRLQLDSYLHTIVHREFPEQGVVVRKPETLRAWLAAYAAATSTTSSYTTILDAATGGSSGKPSKATTVTYRDVLAQLWLLDPVPAWLPGDNRLQRLAKAPKHQLADPALAARLLHLDRLTLLEGRAAGPGIPREGTLLGALFEHLVGLSVLVYAQASEAHVGHLRALDGGHEVDLIVEQGCGVVALEVKLTAAVGDRDVRHLLWLRDRIGERLRDAVVVTTGPEAYRRADGIAVVPAALLGP